MAWVGLSLSDRGEKVHVMEKRPDSSDKVVKGAQHSQVETPDPVELPEEDEASN